VKLRRPPPRAAAPSAASHGRIQQRQRLPASVVDGGSGADGTRLPTGQSDGDSGFPWVDLAVTKIEIRFMRVFFFHSFSLSLDCLIGSQSDLQTKKLMLRMKNDVMNRKLQIFK
jgi:hypothetical protein